MIAALLLSQFEADRRTINITINSFGTELQRDDRARMYPRFGKLYPEGTAKLEKCDDYEAVKTALDGYGEFRDMFRVRLPQRPFVHTFRFKLVL